jgi:hypothetical protein
MLRRARSRCRFALNQGEKLAQGYRDKLGDFEARIHAIAPELELRARLSPWHSLTITSPPWVDSGAQEVCCYAV